MSILANNLLDAGHAIIQYSSSNQVLAYEKDGQQQVEVELLSLERWGLLYSQISRIFPRLYYLPVTPLFIGLTFLAISQFKEEYLNDRQKIVQQISDALVPNYEEGRPVRRIPWETVQAWLGGMGERYGDDVDIWYSYVIEEKDLIGDTYSTLSKEGIELLLRDMNILAVSE